mgnify:CR=1 FL=1
MKIKDFDKQQHDLDTDSDILLAPEEVAVEDKQLIVYNDDFNTFDHVIESLIKVSYEALEPMCTALLERGITAEIE